jgi:hypothetical protein
MHFRGLKRTRPAKVGRVHRTHSSASGAKDGSVLTKIKAFIDSFGTFQEIGPNDYHLRFPDTDALIKFNMLRFPTSIFSIH